MLKKCLSIIVSILLIITSITGISLVTTYATGDIATPDIVTTTSVETTPATTLRNISRAELESYSNQYGWTIPGEIFINLDKVRDAIDYAKEVLANPNATQEEINFAYYNLENANNSVDTIGYIASPFLSGDCDDDDEVTIKDATYLQMIIVKLKSFDQSDELIGNCYMDVNFDFKINIKDVTMIQCFVAGYTDEASCGYVGQRRSPRYYFNNQYSLD